MSEDALDKGKKIIDDLIPNLLNDKNSEPRTYNKDKVQELFGILLEHSNVDLCKYKEDKVYNIFFNDIYAVEYGLTTICRKIREEIFAFSKTLPSLGYFVDTFEFKFSYAISRIPELLESYGF